MDSMPDNRTLGQLLSELSGETSTLVRQEIALARSELTRNLARAGRHAAAIAGGGALVYAGVLTLVFAVVLVLVGAGLAPWLAALVTGVVVLSIGYALFQYGLAALRRDRIAPEEAVDTMKENAQWAKNQLR